MKITRLLLFAAIALTVCVPFASPAEQHVRTIVDFNAEWRLFEGDQAYAEKATLDDSGWRAITVPHDWSIARPVDEKNLSGQGGGFFPTGIAWYRKSFSLPAKDAHHHVYIVFDGVMANSDVWINGFHLGHRPNGYVSFFYDLSGHVQFGTGGRNVIAVRCDTSKQPASRWYEGGGIYRPVRLVLMQDVHLDPWSTFVTASSVTAVSATVRSESTVVNESGAAQKAALEITLTSPEGRSAGSIITPEQTIAPGVRAAFTAEISVPAPHLWEIEYPSLYRVLVRVKASRVASRRIATSDDEQILYGIREIHFDATTGFWLNGSNLKIKGVALHADGGVFGIAVPNAIWEHRLTALRALGVNAIRTAHNPPSPQFLDLCDRLGFLVMEEFFDCWTVGKNPYDYHLDFEQWASIDIRDTVHRDRNHPSIILWNVGNEIRETSQADHAKGILAGLIAAFHENDSTRPVTQSLFRPNVSHDYDDGLADMLDVVGQNYRDNELLAAHAQKPSRKILGTESGHGREVWLALRDHAPYSGQFLWVGIDYLGEAGQWPNISRPTGLLDRTALPHPLTWERQSWWAAAPNVHIARRADPVERTAIDPGRKPRQSNLPEPLLRDWTPSNIAPHSESVRVFTNCEEAELFLNGQSLGRQKLHPDATPLTWEVPYAPGSLKAVAYRESRSVAEDELRTAGKAARILLTPERATLSPDGNDVLTVVATVVDDAGVQVPDSDPAASGEVQFSVSGPAEIVATDNGSVTDHESFLLPRHHLYDGRVVAILRATAPSGSILVHASTSGLVDGYARLTAVPSLPLGFARAF